MEDKDKDIIIGYYYILDYSDCSICELAITKENETLDKESLFKIYGCNIDECSYMYSDHELNILPLVEIEQHANEH